MSAGVRKKYASSNDANVLTNSPSPLGEPTRLVCTSEGLVKDRVLVIVAHALFRKGVAQLMEQHPRFTIVGEAATGAEGLSLFEELNPDLVLLDMQPSGRAGLDTLKALKAYEASPRVILLTVSDTEWDLFSAFRAGADGYVLKESHPEEFLSNVEAVCSGCVIRNESWTDIFAYAMQAKHGAVASLTEREMEILEFVAKGLSNRGIASELDITKNTVKVHIRHILTKLHVRSRLEAAMWAIQKRPDGATPTVS